MRLEQLEYLVAISKSRSLSEASKRLYVTQQSLGKALSNLEQEIGTTLIIRGHNGCYLTKDGQEVLADAKSILETISNLKTRYRVCPDDTGDVVLLSCPSVHETVLQDIIAQFTQRMPRVNVTALAKDSYLVPDAHRRFIECSPEKVVSIINIPDKHEALIEKVKANNLQFHPLTTDQWVACISKENPLARKSKLSLKELLREPLIIEYPDYPEVGIDRTTLDYYSKYGTPQVKKAVDSEKLLYSSIQRNEYIAFASNFYIERSALTEKYPGITVRNFTPSISSEIGYLIADTDACDPIVQTLVSCLEESIGGAR